MLKSSLTLAVFGAVLTVSAISPAFAGSQKLIAPNAVQQLNRSAAFEPEYICGTHVPGNPPRPHFELHTVLQNQGILELGPKPDDPSAIKFNSQLGSTGVGNPPGVLNGLNPQPLPPQSCANLK